MPDATPSAPYRQVRAQYDEDTIAVYQAYSPEIAEPAVGSSDPLCLPQSLHLEGPR